MPLLTHCRSIRLRRLPLPRLPWSLLCWGALLATLACESQSPPPPPPETDADKVYWALQLNHHAVLLSTTAPYDTLTLVATPENARGAALAGLGTPRYHSTDPDHVQVSTDGVLRAIGPVTQAVVQATLTVGGLTHTDEVWVDVVENPTPPVLTTFSAHPVPPDSTKLATGAFRALPVQAFDAEGNPLTVPVYFRSSNPTIAGIDRTTGFITTGSRNVIGPVTFHASTTAFGITKADTVPFRIGAPILAFIEIWRREATTFGGPAVNVFVPSEITVGSGAIVVWQTSLDVATDVTFADPSQVAAPALLMEYPWSAAFLTCTFADYECGAGNTAPLVLPPGSQFFSSGGVRAFPVPGTYEYHSALHGSSGRIRVIDESGH